MDVQRINVRMRLNTGPVKCEGDWPGVFIRGDEAMAFAQLLQFANKALHLNGLGDLEKLMLSSFGSKD